MKNYNHNDNSEQEQDFYDNGHEVPPDDSDYGSDFGPVSEFDYGEDE